MLPHPHYFQVPECPSSGFQQMAVLRFLDRVNAELRKLQSAELNRCELRGWLCKVDQVF